MADLELNTSVKITFRLTDKNLAIIKKALKSIEKAGMKLSDPDKENEFETG